MKKILSTTAFDIVLVPFPFSDLSLNKKRPCMVLSSISPKGLNSHSVVSMITSNMMGLDFPYDYEIEDYLKAGLPKPSVLRLSKIVTIDNQIILSKLGKLQEADMEKVVSEFRKLFSSFL